MVVTRGVILVTANLGVRGGPDVSVDFVPKDTFLELAA